MILVGKVPGAVAPVIDRYWAHGHFGQRLKKHARLSTHNASHLHFCKFVIYVLELGADNLIDGTMMPEIFSHLTSDKILQACQSAFWVALTQPLRMLV